MKESNLAKTYLPKWQAENPGGRLFRNNTGMAWQGKNVIHKITEGIKYIVITVPKPIFYGIGLMKKSKKKGRKHPVGGGDYIGWTEKLLCDIMPDEMRREYLYEYCEKHIIKESETFKCDSDCPLKVAIFTSFEFKTAGISESIDQVRFRKLIEKSGGISKVIKEGGV